MPPLTAKKLSKIRKKNRKREEKSGKKLEEEKSGRKGQNREGSFTFPLLTNRAGYATVQTWIRLVPFDYRAQNDGPILLKNTSTIPLVIRCKLEIYSLIACI